MTLIDLVSEKDTITDTVILFVFSHDVLKNVFKSILSGAAEDPPEVWGKLPCILA